MILPREKGMHLRSRRLLGLNANGRERTMKKSVHGTRKTIASTGDGISVRATEGVTGTEIETEIEKEKGTETATEIETGTGTETGTVIEAVDGGTRGNGMMTDGEIPGLNLMMNQCGTKFTKDEYRMLETLVPLFSWRELRGEEKVLCMYLK